MYMLYCSLLLSYTNYCSEIWGNTYATNVECIPVLQKRVVRLVCGARRLDHTNPLFKQLGILKFVDLVKFKTSIIMFKAYHNELPDSLQKMFNLYVQIYDSRQKYTFSVQRKIDVHLNIWREIVEFTAYRHNQLQKFASVFKYVQAAHHFNVLYLGH